MGRLKVVRNESLKNCPKPCVVAHICHLSTSGSKQEDHEFEAKLGYVARLFLKKQLQTKKPPKALLNSCLLEM
jgi:hypothetical protein